MRVLFKFDQLARGAALIVVSGMVAGCSSGVSRFTTDGIFTGATNNQRSILRNDNQPYPADVARPKAASGQYVASSARAAVAPAPVASQVQRSALPAPSAPSAVPSMVSSEIRSAPVQNSPVQPERVAVAKAPVAVDPTPTGTVKPTVEKQRSPAEDGWSSEGGRVVTLKDGENLGTLSDRYGVPVKAIVNANGFTNANSLRSGQRVIIPVYKYARKDGDAQPVKQVQAPAPADKKPAPSNPAENVAVLPSQPKLKEKENKADLASKSLASSEPIKDKGVYTVVSGDSLHSISRKTGASVDTIRKANGLDQSSKLKIGQKLKVPAGGAQVVAAAPAATAKTDEIITGTAGSAKQKPVTEPKSAAAPANKPNLATYTPPTKRDDSAIKAAVSASDEKAPDGTGIGKMRWPVRGRVVSSYASGGDGIDIAVPEGTPVKAAENGVVIFAGEGLKDFGRTVLVRHADGKVTVYGHASEVNVKRGDTVRRGQEIARSGMTGSTDTPKLHFEVRENSKAVDPQKFLE